MNQFIISSAIITIFEKSTAYINTYSTRAHFDSYSHINSIFIFVIFLYISTYSHFVYCLKTNFYSIYLSIYVIFIRIKFVKYSIKNNKNEFESFSYFLLLPITHVQKCRYSRLTERLQIILHMYCLYAPRQIQVLFTVGSNNNDFEKQFKL